MATYWNSTKPGQGYADDYHINHHSNQNNEISIDFLKNINNTMKQVIIDSKTILEVGTGTGELLNLLGPLTNADKLGIDISTAAIEYANKKYGNNKTRYMVHDCLKNDLKDIYDLTICSNTLEHFKDPYKVLDRFRTFSKYVLILVPYNQDPMTDGYSEEGGAGHVFKFIDDSFSKYDVVAEYKFRTNGWQCGVNPLQWAVLIKY